VNIWDPYSSVDLVATLFILTYFGNRPITLRLQIDLVLSANLLYLLVDVLLSGVDDEEQLVTQV
jgi:hypothetical protein